MRGLGRWAATEAVIAYCRVDKAVRRMQSGLAAMARGFVTQSMSNGELAELVGRAYALDPGPSPSRGLFAWELAWYLKRLPQAPASALVSGAGAGREVAWLVERGYRVDATEPSGAAVASCRARFASVVEVHQGSHEDLSRAVLNSRPPGRLAVIATRQYDAAILGWGSLGHVLERAERIRAVEAIAALVPAGPILASFPVVSRKPNVASEASRGWKLGAALGRALGGEDHSEARAADPLWFDSRYGVVAAIRCDEVGEMAGRVSRRAVWEGSHGEYPHVTLLPGDSIPQ
jgi:hypothetical protein